MMKLSPIIVSLGMLSCMAGCTSQKEYEIIYVDRIIEKEIAIEKNIEINSAAHFIPINWKNLVSEWEKFGASIAWHYKGQKFQFILTKEDGWRPDSDFVLYLEDYEKSIIIDRFNIKEEYAYNDSILVQATILTWTNTNLELGAEYII